MKNIQLQEESILTMVVGLVSLLHICIYNFVAAIDSDMRNIDKISNSLEELLMSTTGITTTIKVSITVDNLTGNIQDSVGTITMHNLLKYSFRVDANGVTDIPDTRIMVMCKGVVYDDFITEINNIINT